MTLREIIKVYLAQISNFTVKPCNEIRKIYYYIMFEEKQKKVVNVDEKCEFSSTDISLSDKSCNAFYADLNEIITRWGRANELLWLQLWLWFVYGSAHAWTLKPLNIFHPFIFIGTVSGASINTDTKYGISKIS